MSRIVFIDKKELSVDVAIMENNRVEHFYQLENDLIVGSIVLGKVEKIIKQLGVFVNIGRSKNALLRYRDGLRIGDMIIVQILREECGEKGCSVSDNLTIAGRYTVLNDVGEYRFSRKISQLRVQELKKIRLEDKKVGIVFRSLCEQVDDNLIKNEAEELYNKYLNVIKKGANNMKIQFLYEEKGIEVAKRFALSDDEIVYGFEDIYQELATLNERKIEVEGVEIVFDKTEAMTVVDVNSHKFRHKYKDIDTAHYHANVIALKEIARQIRLRNIGGIIMVDFISLSESRLKLQLLDELKKELMLDNVMVKAELIESLSLIAIVRKKRYSENKS
ncbi:MAG TPA: ribonuclease E/G [Clostridia bacterium]|nr:ribonuclease E/G [Clostridia bacterium]